jgi:hypothetical protein
MSTLQSIIIQLHLASSINILIYIYSSPHLLSHHGLFPQLCCLCFGPCSPHRSRVVAIADRRQPEGSHYESPGYPRAGTVNQHRQWTTVGSEGSDLEPVSIVIGQGPFPQIINQYVDIVSTSTTFISQSGGSRPVESAADQTAIYNAYREFARVNQATLNILSKSPLHSYEST